MQMQGSLHQKFLFNSMRKINQNIDCRNSTMLVSKLFPSRSITNSCCGYATRVMKNDTLKSSKINSFPEENFEGFSDDDDDDELCPVECVREFKTDEEFLGILEKAKEINALVVVDFYRTSCGSCKYIEQGFAKLCKGAGDQEDPVIFLKHNVLDEYDEQSETADRLRIRSVPLFHFYKNGVLLEAFPTRDKERILEAIRKYTSASQEVESMS